MRNFDKEVADLAFKRTEEGRDPEYLLLDRQNYFELKMYFYKNYEIALIEEIEEFQGLKVFYNTSEDNYFDVV